MIYLREYGAALVSSEELAPDAHILTVAFSPGGGNVEERVDALLKDFKSRGLDVYMCENDEYMTKCTVINFLNFIV